jgi:thiosulfate reductase cytochrome b subunit
MTDLSASTVSNMSSQKADQLHPPIVRVTHWINAIAMIVMIGSGWRIYNDSPLIPDFHFSTLFSLGGDPDTSYAIWQNTASGALQWHFAMMWVLVINGLVYLTYGFVSGRFKRMLLPVSVTGIWQTVRETLSFKLNHEHGVYNHVQRVLYIGVICLAVLIVLSGLAIWKPVQFQWLAAYFGSFQGARWVHFLCMVGIVLFLVIHVVLAALVPSTIVSMTVGDRVNDQHRTGQGDTP